MSLKFQMMANEDFEIMTILKINIKVQPKCHVLFISNMIKYTSETPQSQELLQFPRCLDRLHIGSWEIRGPWIVLDWYLWNPIKYIMISIIINYSFNLLTCFIS